MSVALQNDEEVFPVGTDVQVALDELIAAHRANATVGVVVEGLAITTVTVLAHRSGLPWNIFGFEDGITVLLYLGDFPPRAPMITFLENLHEAATTC
jgi:hypothetical protein